LIAFPPAPTQHNISMLLALQLPWATSRIYIATRLSNDPEHLTP